MAPTQVRLPPSPKVEIEFSAGIWTDVTPDVYPDVQPPNMTFGRSNEFAAPSRADFSVALDNTSQRYTPQNTASPYYPNVQRRKRIRYSYNLAVLGVTGLRFVGYIKKWQPTLLDGYRPVMQITAACRMDQLSRVKMLSPIRQEVTLDDPALWWPLTDDVGSVQALEQSGNSGPPLGVTGTGTALVFGDNGPGFGDGTGVIFAGGQYLTATTSLINGASAFSFDMWIQTTSTATNVLVAQVGGGVVSINPTGNGRPRLTAGGGVSIDGPNSVIDGSWHHLSVSFTGGIGSWDLAVDGVYGVAQGGTAGVVPIQIGAGFTGNIGQIAAYPVALSSARVLAHFQAGRGYYGDSTAQRIARFLGYAGLTSSDWNLDTGQAVVNTYPQDGVDVLTGCQDMVTTEGGGAVLYTDPQGLVRFVNRRYRDNRTPALTLTVGDIDPSIYQPSLDDDALLTKLTANRASESGTQTSQTYDSGTVDVFASDVTTYTISDLDALALIQYIVNSQTTQALRFPQISVDLAAADHDLYNTVAALRIGDRVRVNFPPVAYPVATLDFFIEGWTETPTADARYPVVFDVSAADNPGPRFQLDLSTLDGPDVLAL